METLILEHVRKVSAIDEKFNSLFKYHKFVCLNNIGNILKATLNFFGLSLMFYNFVTILSLIFNRDYSNTYISILVIYSLDI